MKERKSERERVGERQSESAVLERENVRDQSVREGQSEKGRDKGQGERTKEGEMSRVREGVG